MKIAVSPIAWNNEDFPHLSLNLGLDDCLSRIQRSGASGTEWSSALELSPSPRVHLAAHGLAAAGAWLGVSLLDHGVSAELAVLDRRAERLLDAECTTLVVAEVGGASYGSKSSPLAARRRLSASERAAFHGAIEEFFAESRARGFSPVYHAHLGTVVQTGEEIQALLDATDVSMALDTGHCAAAGVDLLALLEPHRSRVGHVHLKQVRESVLGSRLDEDKSFFDLVSAGLFATPDEAGRVDMKAVSMTLVAGGYDRWWVVEAEQDPTLTDPDAAARRGVDAVHGWLRCGL